MHYCLVICIVSWLHPSQMTQPDIFENLYTRLGQRDPAKGCLDPGVLASPDGRDFAEVTVTLPGGSERVIRLPAFWAHLVDTKAMWDPENCEPVSHEGKEVFAEGTWSGGLLWDASIVATELLLKSSEWQARIRGAICLELGSGLGLPGLICSLLGARTTAVTDRPAVAGLVEDAIRMNDLGATASALSFEWDEDGARGLLDTIGSFPDVIIAVSFLLMVKARDMNDLLLLPCMARHIRSILPNWHCFAANRPCPRLRCRRATASNSGHSN